MEDKKTNPDEKLEFKLISFNIIENYVNYILSKNYFSKDENNSLKTEIETLFNLEKNFFKNKKESFWKKAWAQFEAIDGNIIKSNDTIKLDNWNKTDFLIIHFYLLSIVIIFLNNNLINLQEKSRTDLIGAIKIELHIILNTYFISYNYEKIYKNKSNNYNNFIDKFIEELYKKFLTSQQRQLCFPTGSKEHAIYLTFIKMNNNKLWIRADNSMSDDNKIGITPKNVGIFDLNNSKDKILLKNYLIRVCEANFENHNDAMDKIYNTGSRKIKEIRNFKSKDFLENYPKVIAQTAHNCVVEGFKMGMYYRLCFIDSSRTLLGKIINYEAKFLYVFGFTPKKTVGTFEKSNPYEETETSSFEALTENSSFDDIEDFDLTDNFFSDQSIFNLNDYLKKSDEKEENIPSEYNDVLNHIKFKKKTNEELKDLYINRSSISHDIKTCESKFLEFMNDSEKQNIYIVGPKGSGRDTMISWNLKQFFHGKNIYYFDCSRDGVICLLKEKLHFESTTKLNEDFIKNLFTGLLNNQLLSPDILVFSNFEKIGEIPDFKVKIDNFIADIINIATTNINKKTKTIIVSEYSPEQLLDLNLNNKFFKIDMDPLNCQDIENYIEKFVNYKKDNQVTKKFNIKNTNKKQKIFEKLPCYPASLVAVINFIASSPEIENILEFCKRKSLYEKNLSINNKNQNNITKNELFDNIRASYSLMIDIATKRYESAKLGIYCVSLIRANFKFPINIFIEILKKLELDIDKFFKTNILHICNDFFCIDDFFKDCIKSDVTLSKHKMTECEEKYFKVLCEKFPKNYIEAKEMEKNSLEVMDILRPHVQFYVKIESYNIFGNSLDFAIRLSYRFAIYLAHIKANFHKAYDIFKKIELYNTDIGEDFLNTFHRELGAIFFRNGSYYESKNSLLLCLDNEKDNYLLGFANHVMGNLYYNLPDYKKALEYMNIAQQKYIESKQEGYQIEQNFINCLNNIDENKLPDFETSCSAIEFGFIYHDKANVYAALNKFDIANQLYNRAKKIKINKLSEKSTNTGLLYDVRGMSSIDMGRFKYAEKSLKKAYKIYKFSNKYITSDKLRVKYYLAKNFLENGKYANSLLKFQKIIEILKQNGSLLIYLPMYAKVTCEISSIQLISHEYKAAYVTLTEVLNQLEKRTSQSDYAYRTESLIQSTLKIRQLILGFLTNSYSKEQIFVILKDDIHLTRLNFYESFENKDNKDNKDKFSGFFGNIITNPFRRKTINNIFNASFVPSEAKALYFYELAFFFQIFGDHAKSLFMLEKMEEHLIDAYQYNEFSRKIHFNYIINLYEQGVSYRLITKATNRLKNISISSDTLNLENSLLDKILPLTYPVHDISKKDKLEKSLDKLSEALELATMLYRQDLFYNKTPSRKQGKNLLIAHIYFEIGLTLLLMDYDENFNKNNEIIEENQKKNNFVESSPYFQNKEKFVNQYDDEGNKNNDCSRSYSCFKTVEKIGKKLKFDYKFTTKESTKNIAHFKKINLLYKKERKKINLDMFNFFSCQYFKEELNNSNNSVNTGNKEKLRRGFVPTLKITGYPRYP